MSSPCLPNHVFSEPACMLLLRPIGPRVEYRVEMAEAPSEALLADKVHNTGCRAKSFTIKPTIYVSTASEAPSLFPSPQCRSLHDALDRSACADQEATRRLCCEQREDASAWPAFPTFPALPACGSNRKWLAPASTGCFARIVRTN